MKGSAGGPGGTAQGGGKFAEGGRGGTGPMAQHLAMVEQQAEGEGQQADHRQHHQSLALVRGGFLQVGIRRDRLKHLGIDLPPAAAELVKEQRRDSAEFRVAGVEGGGDVLGRLCLPPRRNGLVFYDDA